MEKINRNNTFDILKGIAIISVVVYHTIPHFLTTTNSVILISVYNISDQFQIPLFLFISGYFFFFSMEKNEGFKDILLKKTIRLLIPYMIFGSLLFFSKGIYLSLKGAYAINIQDYCEAIVTMHSVKIVNGNGLGFGPTWFLLMLYIITLISFITSKRDKIAETIFVAFIFSSIFFVREIPKSPDFTFNSLLYFIIPFQGGYFTNKYKLLEKPFLKSKANQMVFGAFLLILVILYKVFEYREVFNVKTIGIAVLMILSFYLAVELIKDKIRIIGYIGKHSMVIYLLHAPYLMMIGLIITKFIPSGNLWVTFGKILIVFIICILGSLILNQLYTLIKEKLIKKITLNENHQTIHKQPH